MVGSWCITSGLITTFAASGTGIPPSVVGCVALRRNNASAVESTRMLSRSTRSRRSSAGRSARVGPRSPDRPIAEDVVDLLDHTRHHVRVLIEQEQGPQQRHRRGRAARDEQLDREREHFVASRI